MDVAVAVGVVLAAPGKQENQAITRVIVFNHDTF